MKLLSASVVLGNLFGPLVGAVQQQADIFYHNKKPLGPTMWHFSPEGVSIYSPDGELVKKHHKKSLCQPYTSYDGSIRDTCSFFTMTSDGQKYVWAAVMSGKHRVAAFDIDSGEYAGYIESCSTPLDLKYHATRQEMWLRCADKSGEDHDGEIEVFSSNSLSSGFPSVYLNDTSRPYGRISVDSTMGNLGYVTAYNSPFFTEIDLSTKEVNDRYAINKAYGAYDMTFSPVNGHAFFRTRVCCTCGSPSADVESCGRYGSPKEVLVQTGPNASEEEQIGVCSSPCQGSAADTIGVVEFDTVNKVFVGEHNIKEGTGFGAKPYTAPDGKHIFLFGNDGGQNVRVLEAKENGQKSELITDIPVNFKGGTPGQIAVSDFAFINEEERSILVLGAHHDNEIVLVDFEDNFSVTRLNLSPDAAEPTGGSSRKIEWAVGTDYVWVSGGESLEQYVIDLSKGAKGATVSRTLQDIPSGDMIFVNNYQRQREVEMMQEVSYQSISDRGTNRGIGITGFVFGLVAFVAVVPLLAQFLRGSPQGREDGKEQFKEDL